MEVDERHVNHQVLDICGAVAMAPLLVKNKVKPEWTKQILCKYQVCQKVIVRAIFANDD